MRIEPAPNLPLKIHKTVRGRLALGFRTWVRVSAADVYIASFDNGL